MKLPVEMLAVVAMKLPVSTRLPALNSTPFGFTSTTWPVPLKVPRMLEACSPVTRLSTAARSPGCWKCTRSPAPMLKLRQSITARSDF